MDLQCVSSQPNSLIHNDMSISKNFDLFENSFDNLLVWLHIFYIALEFASR